MNYRKVTTDRIPSILECGSGGSKSLLIGRPDLKDKLFLQKNQTEMDISIEYFFLQAPWAFQDLLEVRS